jgi:hypothetical protein
MWQKGCTHHTSHRPSPPDAYGRAATDVGNTLRDAKSADPPVERPTKFERAIKLKTAYAHNRRREVVSPNSASAALECSETRWRTQGQRRRITARISAAGETGYDNPSGQRLTALLPFPQWCPSPVPYRSSPSPVSCPSAPKLATSSTKAFLLTQLYILVY